MDWGQLYVDMQMNNVYKSVRNEALGAFVAVPANSPTRDKRSGRIAASSYALCANTHQHEKSTPVTFSPGYVTLSGTMPLLHAAPRHM